MTEYETFDDYVRNIFKIEPTELTHISPEEQKKKTVEITADELINIWNELTELKADNDARKFAMTMSEKVEKQLRKENAELKIFRQDCVKLTEDNAVMVRQRAEISKQLTKAKEIIKKIEKVFYNGENALKRLSKISDILAEAEQFLKDDSCPDCFCEDCTKDCGIKKLGLVEVVK